MLARAEASGSAYGEIDFIVVNPFGQLLAIEQKDGQIVAKGADLYARYGGRQLAGDGAGQAYDKSITTQVNRNLHALRAQFARRYPGRTLQIDHLLYLPTAQQVQLHQQFIDQAPVQRRDHVGEGAVEGALAV